MHNKNPAFQFYPADYLIDEKVQLMTLEQEGAYIRALSYCWREGSIPADPKILALLIGKGCSEETARGVQGCFKQDATDKSRMVHLRLNQEREKQNEWKRKSALGGIRSGESRKNKSEKIGKTKSCHEVKGGSKLVQAKANISSSSSISNTKVLDVNNVAALSELQPIHYQLTEFLIERILAQQPSNRLSKKTYQNSARRTWPSDFEKMIRLDSRAPPEIREMIEWSTQHPFWAANILSARKLREKWDTLKMQKSNEERSGKNQSTDRKILQRWEELDRFDPSEPSELSDFFKGHESNLVADSSVEAKQ